MIGLSCMLLSVLASVSDLMKAVLLPLSEPVHCDFHTMRHLFIHI